MKYLVKNLEPVVGQLVWEEKLLQPPHLQTKILKKATDNSLIVTTEKEDIIVTTVENQATT